MGIALFEFVFETLRQRLNQPSNARFWLPARLDAIAAPSGGPLLPLHATGWSLGTIGGPAGADLTAAFTGQWLILLNYKHRDDGGTVGHQAIACPDDPLPRLSMPEVTVVGLDNVMILPGAQVTEPSGAGYRANLTAKFNAYDAAHPPARSSLSLSGTYNLTLCVCTAPSAVAQPTACDGWESTVIDGSGLFAVSFSDTFADITMTLGPAADGKGGVAVGVESVVMRGPTEGSLPTLSIDQLTVVTKASWLADNVWIPKATEAFESPQGRAALVGNLNAALNEPGNRGQLATMLTSRLNDIFDGALGAVPAGGLPATGAAIANPVDQLLFERFAATLNDPTSAYFVPRLVRASGSPVLEPLTLSNVGLPDLSFAGISFTGVSLTALDATGLSNAAALPAELCLRPWGVETTLQVATLDPPPTVTIELDGHEQALMPRAAAHRGRPVPGGTVRLAPAADRLGAVHRPPRRGTRADHDGGRRSRSPGDWLPADRDVVAGREREPRGRARLVVRSDHQPARQYTGQPARHGGSLEQRARHTARSTGRPCHRRREGHDRRAARRCPGGAFHTSRADAIACRSTSRRVRRGDES